jgi:hypothetical protein
MEIKFVELKQRHIEAFHVDLPDITKVSGPSYSSAVIRSALKAGWLIEPKIEDVGEMDPGDCLELARAIVQEEMRVMRISPS